MSERASTGNRGVLRMTAAAVMRETSALRNPERAQFLQRYFRTGLGEYAEGDRMLGLTVPEQRRVARAFRLLPVGEVERLLRSKFHKATGWLLREAGKIAPGDLLEFLRVH